MEKKQFQRKMRSESGCWSSILKQRLRYAPIYAHLNGNMKLHFAKMLFKW